MASRPAFHQPSHQPPHQPSHPRASRAPRIATLLAVALIASVGAVGAQTAGGAKVGVVDTSRLVRESQIGKAMAGRLEIRQKELEATFEVKAGELQALTQRIGDGQGKLPVESLEAMNRERETRTIEIRRLSDDAQKELAKMQEELLGDLDRRVMPIIQQVAEEGGYTLVFRKFESGLLHVADGIDVTAEVVRRLDAAPR